MPKLYPRSRIEIEGFLARHYGTLLNLITAGKYKDFIEKAIDNMDIKPQDKIVDLGAGPGYNARIMANYLGSEGKILGLDIGDEVISIFRKRFGYLDNVKIEKRRIDQPLPYNAEFDKALASFVIHGLPHPSREKLLDNARKILKKEGKLFILDYGNFKLSEIPFYQKIPFKTFECEYAFDYLKRDWEKILEDNGFEVVDRYLYWGKFTRLLVAKKLFDSASEGSEA